MKLATKAFLGVVSLIGLGVAYADPASYTMYYTTFNTVNSFREWKVTAAYTGNGTAGNGTFSLTGDTGIANTGGSDGIVLNPNNGQLLVGGQGNAVYQVDPTTGSFTSATPNVSAFHLAVDPAKQVVWASGIPGALSSLPINPFGGAGTIKTITGDDTNITSLAFTPGGTVFYTDADASGFGNFGIIDMTTGVTTRKITSLQAAHGIQYDPFTGDLILGGNDEIAQIDPSNPTAVLSSQMFSGNTFDQGAVDGLGHIYWASNSGQFFFMDYSTTGLVGNSNNFVSDQFFKSAMDDVAPLIGAGGTNPTVPEPSAVVLLGTLLVLVGLKFRRKAANLV